MAKRRCKGKLNVYFDCETYIVGDFPQEILKAYLIGWTDDRDPTCLCYSLEPHHEFFNYLEEMALEYSLALWAHNAQYDILVLYPIYLNKFPHTFKLHISDNNNFITCNYSAKGRFRFTLYDTWIWNKLSLASYMEELKLPRKTSIDYDKHNCNYEDGEFHYINGSGEPRSVSLFEELEYLKNDVLALPKVKDHIDNLKKKGCLYSMLNIVTRVWSETLKQLHLLQSMFVILC